MAITYVANHSAETTSTSITLNVPSGAAAGDLLLAFVHSAGTRATTAGTDFSAGVGKWTLLATGQSSVDDYFVYKRIMQSGDTSWSWSTTASAITQGAIVAYNDSSPKWCVTNAPGVSEPLDSNGNSSPAPAAPYVYDGCVVYCGMAYRSSTGLTGISIDQGTSRLATVNAGGTMALAIYDSIGTGNVGAAFTSTTTSTSPPSDHIAFSTTFQSTPTGELYDPSELIYADFDVTGHVYKGRNTAAEDTVGVA